MSKRTWFLLGAGFGFVVPILLNVFRRFGPWFERPTADALFRPGFIAFHPVTQLLPRGFHSGLLVGLVILLVNAIVFGAAAYGLRYSFLLFIAVLLVINFLSLPPSDVKLERNLSVQRKTFERLIEKANQTPSLVRIATDEIEDSEGRKYRGGDPKFPLSPESWSEYRELLQKTGMKEGLYRSPQTGQMQFLTATVVGKIGPIGSLYGYAYCPAQPTAVTTGFLVCRGERDEYDIGDYRYKRLSPEWAIVEIFRTRSLKD